MTFPSAQVYDLDTFKVTHASKYPGPVLSLGISPDCGLLAVGQADGQLSIRKHARPKVVPVEAGMHCSHGFPQGALDHAWLHSRLTMVALHTVNIMCT